MITTTCLFLLFLFTVATSSNSNEPLCVLPGGVTNLFVSYAKDNVTLFWTITNHVDDLKFIVEVTDPITGITFDNENKIDYKSNIYSTILTAGLSVPCKEYEVTVTAFSECGEGKSASLNIYAPPNTNGVENLLLNQKNGTTAIEVFFDLPLFSSKGNCNIKYKIVYAEKYHGGYYTELVKEVIDASRQPILLTDLKAETFFKVSVDVIAYIDTLKNNKLSEFIEIKTGLGQLPRSVEILRFASFGNNVKVNWNPPSLNKLNPVIKYKIVSSCTGEEKFTTKLFQTYVQEQGTSCVYTVNSRNQKGNGPSKSITVTLSEDKCYLPKSIEKLIARYSSTHSQLVWKALVNLNTITSYFTVLLIDAETGETYQNTNKVHCNTNICKSVINPNLLVPCKTYSASVFLSAECGTVQSENVEITAFPATGAPTNLLLASKEGTMAVEVSFDKPDSLSQGVCNVKYEIVYNLKNSQKINVSEVKDISKQPILLTYLKPHSLYECKVNAIAYTKGRSMKNSSNSKEVLTNEGKVPGAVTNLYLMNHADDVRLKWDVPLNDNLNPALNYKVDACGTVVLETKTFYFCKQNPGTRCTYTVSAGNLRGFGLSSSVNLTTLL